MIWANRIVITAAVVHLVVFAMIAFFGLSESDSLLVPLGIEVFVFLCMLMPLIRLSWPTVHLALGAMLFGAFVAIVEFKEFAYVPLRVGHVILLLCVWAGAESAIRGIFMLDVRRAEAVACMAGGFILFTATLGFGTRYAERGAEVPAPPPVEVESGLTETDVMWIKALVSARTQDPLRMIKRSSVEEVEIWAGEYRGGAWRKGTIFYVNREGRIWKFNEEKQGCWSEGPPLEGLPEDGRELGIGKDDAEGG